MPELREAPDGPYDVVVAGAGNAALNAALAAAEAGARVLVLEKAPREARGGNSYFTGGMFRFPYESVLDVEELTGELSPVERDSIDLGQYSEPAFYGDLMRLSDGLSDPNLAQTLVARARPALAWTRRHGVRWVLAYGRQSFKVAGKHKFWGGLACECVGAGKGLIEALFQSCGRVPAIDITYDTMADRLQVDRKGAITGVSIRGASGLGSIDCGAVVLACGGFEANTEMRVRYLGAGWDLVKVRGTEFNTGDGIRMALEIGAQPHGHFSGCHAVAWDAGAPVAGDRRIADLFQKHSYPFGIIVNVRGERFVDEGADFRNYTYAKYGKEILRQPRRLAFQIFDQQVVHLLRDEYRIKEVTSATAGTVRELAAALDIDPDGLERTVAGYNRAVVDGDFNPAVLDGKRAAGIEPPKSNWALRLERPPFVGYAVTCGITFTFGGLRIDTGARVIDTQKRAIPGLYAAGELVGGLFYENYPGGAGLTAGAVFGQIAGRGAALHAKEVTRLRSG
ncbi:MAG: FAD-dependent tricarballylate dehydrogenase TcuA [Chloroflexi bacterium]|nr:FAD-dependent tricarballylate dehydrogenase TcuA [Chloroflexota bacterium]